jgi:hypothetical protein
MVTFAAQDFIKVISVSMKKNEYTGANLFP